MYHVVDVIAGPDIYSGFCVPLVEPNGDGCVSPMAMEYVLVSVEDVGRPYQKGLFPCLDLTGMALAPAGQLGYRLLPLYRLQGYFVLE